MWTVEDELHADHIGRYASRDEALAEIRRRLREPWDGDDNRAPCQSWRTCGRHYVLYPPGTAGSNEWISVARIDPGAVRWLLSE
jgi:hypothetical protein